MTSVGDKAAEALQQLPPLRAVIAQHGLMAKRGLGQNFLLDLNLTSKIARACGDLAGRNVIEVGPGPGGLTRALLMTDANVVHAIERDDRCVEALQDVVAAAEGRLALHADDALKTDYEAICAAPRVVVANLPYNIASPLLVGWLKTLPLFESLTLMFQKEVAERIVARTRTKDYGRLSVLSQWLCHAEKVFDLPPEAFTPPPKVTSSIVHLTPRARTDDVEISLMEKITGAAFGQRRKMLRQSLKTLDLKSHGLDAQTLLEKAALPETARAEEIDVAGFVRLALAYRELTS
ncbi:MAG: 16S rRNA (adenine(1518)-N(6)/adenine(1519)-N(6))-dimethyltransferase RsmA [Alphaproteobacteria bacterium]|nr:16S rRNA (adenine(1518)-N(6)/adenine(1519)-N(6))-dimethyltransferase RsmA [Alphaproteobacteria bacterium]